jgi:hypothetical protein
MLIDFIIYIGNKVFKGYLYAIAFLALCLTIFSFAFIKFVLIFFNAPIVKNDYLKGFLQLSYLCYIPLVLILIFRKFRYQKFINDELKVRNISHPVSLTAIILISIILFILFTYTLMIW